MKFLFDLFPVLAFVGGYVSYDIFVATAAGIAASFIQTGFLLWRHRSVEKVHIVNLIAFTVFGGATLLFHDESFVQWKVTIVNALFALAMLFSQWFMQKNLLQHMLGEQLVLPKPVWTKLAYSWAAFFGFIAVLNLWIASRFDLDTWVAFKLGGILGLTLIMVIAQAVYLARHIKPDPDGGSS